MDMETMVDQFNRMQVKPQPAYDLKAELLKWDKAMQSVQNARGLSMEGFAATHGRAFTLGSRPRGIRKGMPKQCFTNAMRRAVRRDLIYVEGYASTGAFFPVLHAWVVDPQAPEIAIEVTHDEFRFYYGVPFAPEFTRSFIERSKRENHWSVIDDWHNQWPLLRMDSDELSKITWQPATSGCRL